MQTINLFADALGQTIVMVMVASFLSVLIGLPLGVILLLTRPRHILASPHFNRVLAFIVNSARSIPFIILMIAIVPFTHFVVGTSIGTVAAIVPLTVAAIPFVARLMEAALEQVPAGLVEAAEAMGASPLQIITKFMIPEALPSIIRGITLTLITLVAYSAMAGAIGGGGLGDLAIQYGYERFDTSIMIGTVVLLIIFVQLLQLIGDYTVKCLMHNQKTDNRSPSDV